MSFIDDFLGSQQDPRDLLNIVAWCEREIRKLKQTKPPASVEAVTSIASNDDWSKWGIFNVMLYNAAGDGTTDDTAAIQAAIDALNAAGGGILYFPAGTYLISDTLDITVNCIVLGAGSGGEDAENGVSEIQAATTDSTGILHLTGIVSYVRDIALTYIGGALGYVPMGVFAYNSDTHARLFCENVSINLCNEGIVAVMNLTARHCRIVQQYNEGILIQVQGTVIETSVIEDCSILRSSGAATCTGIVVMWGHAIITNNRIDSLDGSLNFDTGISLVPLGNDVQHTVVNNTVAADRDIHLDVDDTYTGLKFLIHNNILKNTSSGSDYGIWCEAGGGSAVTMALVISGNVFSGGSTQEAIHLTYVDGAYIGGNLHDFGSLLSQANCANISGSDVHSLTRLVTTVASSATPSINVDVTDLFTITALATNITSMTTGLSGTPVNGQLLEIRFLDNGTQRSITWGASYVARGAALPANTTAGKYTRVYLEYNSAASIWDCLQVITEA